MSDEKKVERRLGVQFVSAARSDVITDEMVASAREKGVSWICAHCVHFWWGISRGHPQCWAVFAKKPCGGPMAELAFPEYRGSIPRETFPTFCFVCGAEAEAGVQPHGQTEILGVCEVHEEFIYKMRPRDPKQPLQIVEVPS